jgi:CRISPR-associated endoribonuclease Cas6
MRVKISFVRMRDASNSVPLHHQKLISQCLEDIIKDVPVKTDFYTFSSLKGTSKVQNGYMRFLSSKITLVISSSNSEFVDQVTKRIFEQPSILVGKISLIPKSFQTIPEPDFKTEMKYICISPLVLTDPAKNEMLSQEIVDPSTYEFSDMLYNAIIDNMEKAGFSDADLNEFAVFEATPDKSYVAKIMESGKKYARLYKTNEELNMMGYLLPFTLHAHTKVHQFIWDCGLGVLNIQGYGMIDTVKDEVIENNTNQGLYSEAH